MANLFGQVRLACLHDRREARFLFFFRLCIRRGILVRGDRKGPRRSKSPGLFRRVRSIFLGNATSPPINPIDLIIMDGLGWRCSSTRAQQKCIEARVSIKSRVEWKSEVRMSCTSPPLVYDAMLPRFIVNEHTRTQYNQIS